MKLIFLINIITITLFANNFWDQKVHIFGNLSSSILYNGQGQSLKLNSIKNKENLYAIGLGQNLQNEIQIFNSKPYNTSITNNKTIKFDKTYNSKASFLVYANIPQWKSFKVPSRVYTQKQFEEYLEEIADEYGIDSYKPFPFLLEGNLKANSYRIYKYNSNDEALCTTGMCSAQPNDEIKIKQKYITYTLEDTILNQTVSILGFYSFQKGLITTNKSYTNMNFINQNKTIAGHSRKIMLGENMILKLPKIN